MGDRQEGVSMGSSGPLLQFLSWAFKALLHPAHPPFMLLKVFSKFLAQSLWPYPFLQDAFFAAPGGMSPSLLWVPPTPEILFGPGWHSLAHHPTSRSSWGSAESAYLWVCTALPEPDPPQSTG